MKKFLLGVLVGIAVPVLATLGYLKMGMAEVRADIPPGRWENYLMNTGLHASVRRRAPDVPNPVLPTEENEIAGGKLYLSACAGCHGRPGKPFGGKGPILYPPFPNFRWSARSCLKHKFSGWPSTGSADRGCSPTRLGLRTKTFGQLRLMSSA